jgi:hypothetical protein
VQLNSQASYASIHSTNTLYLVYLAANKLEKALMYAEPSPAATNGARKHGELPGVKVKSAAVGAWFHQNNPSLQILQVSFHPLSDVHLLVLTNDSILRIYNIKENLNLPCREIALDAVAQAPLPQAGSNGGARSSRRNSGLPWQQQSSSSFSTTPERTSLMLQRSTSSAVFQSQVKPMVTGFCFGAAPTSRASFSSSAASRSSSGAESTGWDLFSLFFLFSTGSVSVLCPTVPPKVGVDRRVVVDLRRQEQARLDELKERQEAEQSTSSSSSSQQQVDELEIEQVQARLLWLGDTFGLHMDDATDALQGQGLVVSRDTTGAAQLSGAPQPWIQPAQPCGAQVAPSSGGSSMTPSGSTLALPSLASPGQPSSMTMTTTKTGAYPAPASHLFSFRHAWPVPPGRFFRAFIDGRLDLLLSVQSVQPLFSTPVVQDLFAELDEAMAPSIVRHTHALEQVCNLFGPGGRLEPYSISSLLLPVDVSKIEGVEAPQLAPQPLSGINSTLLGSGGGAAGMFSRSGTMGMLASPGLSRPSSALTITPASSLARGSTYAHGLGAAGGLGSPLHPFNPQFRPLLDLSDGSGFFVVQPRGISRVGYGETLDEIGAALARVNNAEDDALLPVRSLIEQISCEQRPATTTLMSTTPRQVVGAVLIDDPLLGRYLLQLTSGGVSALENVAAPGPHITVIALPRSVHRVPGVKSLMDSIAAAAAADVAAVAVPRLAAAAHNGGSGSLKDSEALVVEGEMARLNKYLSPFAAEIAPFLQRLRHFTPPPALPSVAGGPGALLSSPEAFKSFLSSRSSFVSTIRDLTELQTLVRTRVELLATFSAEQQRLFEELEKDLVDARANQAKIDKQIQLQKDMQAHLGEGAKEMQAQLAVQLHDLSPAELRFHAQLSALRSTLLPRFAHKLDELARKQEHMAQVERELAQAARVTARKGVGAGADATPSSAWSQQQLQQVKPVLHNQAAAISALVQQLAELKKNMTTLRSHSALQRRADAASTAPALLPGGQEPPRRLLPAANDFEAKSLDQPL